MSIAKSMNTYIKILKNAWEITLEQKQWWALAALAGLVYTGAVFNTLMRTFLHLQSADKLGTQQLAQISPFFSWVLSYAGNMALLETPHLLLSISICILIFVLIVFIALVAQHMLLLFVSKGKKEHSWKSICKQLRHIHILRLFSINAIMKILFVIVIGCTTLALAWLSTSDSSLDSLIRTGVFAIALPFAFFIEVFGMIALIGLVKKNASIGKTMVRAMSLLRNHWLVTFELSLILFIVNFITSAILFVILLCVAIIAGMIFEMTLLIGSYVLLSIITFLALLITTALVIIYAGAITTFNYAAWTQMCNYLERYSHFPALEHMLRKILK